MVAVEGEAKTSSTGRGPVSDRRCVWPCVLWLLLPPPGSPLVEDQIKALHNHRWVAVRRVSEGQGCRNHENDLDHDDHTHA